MDELIAAVPGWIARFVPQAWSNDVAFDVDPEGETDWLVTAADVNAALPRDVQGAGVVDAHLVPGWITIYVESATGGNPDLLRQHQAAPEWIRGWRGPFYVKLMAPNPPLTASVAP